MRLLSSDPQDHIHRPFYGMCWWWLHFAHSLEHVLYCRAVLGSQQNTHASFCVRTPEWSQSPRNVSLTQAGMRPHTHKPSTQSTQPQEEERHTWDCLAPVPWLQSAKPVSLMQQPGSKCFPEATVSGSTSDVVKENHTWWQICFHVLSNYGSWSSGLLFSVEQGDSILSFMTPGGCWGIGEMIGDSMGYKKKPKTQVLT